MRPEPGGRSLTPSSETPKWSEGWERLTNSKPLTSVGSSELRTGNKYLKCNTNIFFLKMEHVPDDSFLQLGLLHKCYGKMEQQKKTFVKWSILLFYYDKLTLYMSCVVIQMSIYVEMDWFYSFTGGSSRVTCSRRVLVYFKKKCISILSHVCVICLCGQFVSRFVVFVSNPQTSV